MTHIYVIKRTSLVNDFPLKEKSSHKTAKQNASYSLRSASKMHYRTPYFTTIGWVLDRVHNSRRPLDRLKHIFAIILTLTFDLLT